MLNLKIILLKRMWKKAIIYKITKYNHNGDSSLLDYYQGLSTWLLITYFGKTDQPSKML